MKKFIALFILGLGCAVGGLTTTAHANEATIRLDRAPDVSGDATRLQHGAKLFINHCLNCHGASAMRYNRLMELGLTEQQIKDNLLFTGDKVGDLMTTALTRVDGKKFFGAVPPDLSVIARAKASDAGSGADWLYTYLRTFYRDPTRDTGWNNVLFPNVGMPHVLYEYQGAQNAVFVDKPDPHGEKDEKGNVKTVRTFDRFEQASLGSMSKTEYNEAMANLVGYLKWMGEPAQTQRKQLGLFVLIFLGILTACAFWLNSTFWRDIH